MTRKSLLDRLTEYRNDVRYRQLYPSDDQVVELVDEAIKAIVTLHTALQVANESYRLEQAGPVEDDTLAMTRRM